MNRSIMAMLEETKSKARKLPEEMYWITKNPMEHSQIWERFVYETHFKVFAFAYWYTWLTIPY